MKNRFLSVLFVAVLGWMMISSTTSSGGKSGKTGAPGENDCTQCHSGSAVNSGVGSVSLNTGISGGYSLGQSYNMSVSVSQTGISLFGFSVVALDANGASVGTFVAGSDNHTENLTVSGNNRQYVTHNTNGGASPNSHTFNFTWTSPTSDAGQVTFYVSANAANGNGGASGDFIYTTSSAVSASLGGGGGSFVINEINPDPSEVGADTTEFVELYGTPGMSLDGYVMVCFNGGTGTNNVAYGAYDLDGYSIPASGYFVIGNPAVANVNYVVPVPVAPAAFLQNGPDAIAIYQGNATDWPNGTVATNVNLVDAVVYGTNDPDAAVLIATLTPGQVQADESGGNIEACMARVPNGGLPFQSSAFVEQLPTPGTSNDSAPLSGCTDAAACNFNPNATVSDASCLYLGFPCDDGNAITSNDVITAECLCAGTQTSVSWTFRVDMSTTPVNAPGVYFAANFQGWIPDQDLMSDADGDNIWEITYPAIPVNTPIEYKFLNGPGGWETSPGLELCGVNDLNGAFNRADTTGTTNVILPAVCFNSCDLCNVVSIPGCTDANACNFNSNATIDDGSCINPTLWYLDADADGYYVSDSLSCGAPNAQYTATMGISGDCNDAQSSINAAGTEICGNGIDEDCSGSDLACGVNGCTDMAACNYNPLATVNDGSCINPTMWYLDADGDGYYVSDSLACSAPTADYTSTSGILGDCNDAQAAINAAAIEICDDLDNDCDEEIDEFVQNTYYLDNDADGFGDVNSIALSCSPISGYVTNSDDCDDALLLYLDIDNDGFGGNALAACGEISNTDCNDSNASIYPGANEFCENNIDEDCDGSDLICVGIPGCTNPSACNFDPLAESDNGSCTFGVLWYLDVDADGFASDTIASCTQPSVNYTSSVLILGDCNDSDAAINSAAIELCGNGIDENCDGLDEVCEVPGCTDVAACNFEPQATTDDGTCTYPILWYYDADADGFAADTMSNCSSPGPDYYDNVLPLTDCNDNDSSINGGATEICENGVDEDCDGNDNSCTVLGCTNDLACNFNPLATADDGTCIFGILWFLNADGDNFASDSVSACSSPGIDWTNVVLNLGDCNDTASSIYPGANEICENGLDEDCNGVDDICIITGCTDANACNFNAQANTDDGSCLILGASCDDGDATTGNDVVNANCECVGTPLSGCDLNPIVITLDSILNVECYNAATGYIAVNVSGGNAPFFASWNSFPIQTTPYASGLVAGVYTFTVEDEDGCIGTFSQEITEPAGSLPAVTGNNDVDPAANEQYTVNTYPGCTYSWTVSNGLIVSGQDNDTLNVIWNDADMGTIYVYQTDTATGCQWVDGLAVYINAVGTQEMETNNGWMLYPNPTAGNINIDGLFLNAEITILDATGRIVDQLKAYENTVKIDLREFTNGLYLIQVKDEQGVRTERLIKQ